MLVCGACKKTEFELDNNDEFELNCLEEWGYCASCMERYEE